MPMKNRLHLDFQLSSQAERQAYVDTYIQRPEFSAFPLQPNELEMIANYLLWGKDENGLNEVQKKNVQIASRNRTWNSDDIESLDGLMESPAFNENQIRHYGSVRLASKKEVFDRDAAREICPDSLRPTLEALFREIDEEDLLINIWELGHQKRTEIRKDLLDRFSATEYEVIAASASKLTQHQYLKMRHLLVELRRQQYTLRDSFRNQVFLHNQNPHFEEPHHIVFDADVPVFPLGLFDKSEVAAAIFRDELWPAAFDVATLKKISDLVWKKDSDFSRRGPNELYFDFREDEHVYQLLLFQEDLFLDHDKEKVESTTLELLETLKFYISQATLTDVYREILDLKLAHEKNQDIASHINAKYHKTYTVNYISTIFKQRIVPQITAAAKLHLKTVQNLFFEEEFKKCSGCGKWLLLSEENFVRKTRSKDGFSNRCKKCDKLDRERKKLGM